MQLLFLAALVGGGYLIYQAIAGNESDSDEEYETRRDALQRDA